MIYEETLEGLCILGAETAIIYEQVLDGSTLLECRNELIVRVINIYDQYEFLLNNLKTIKSKILDLNKYKEIKEEFRLLGSNLLEIIDILI